jgi:hypothetical protein
MPPPAPDFTWIPDHQLHAALTPIEAEAAYYSHHQRQAGAA